MSDIDFEYTPTEAEVAQELARQNNEALAELIDAKLAERLGKQQTEAPAPQPAPQPQRPESSFIPLSQGDGNVAGVQAEDIRALARQVIQEEVLNPYGEPINKLLVDEQLKQAKTVVEQHLPDMVDTYGSDKTARTLHDLVYSGNNPYVGTQPEKAVQWAVEKLKDFTPIKKDVAPEYTGDGRLPAYNVVGNQMGIGRPTTSEGWMGAPNGATQKVLYPDLSDYGNQPDGLTRYAQLQRKADEEYLKRKNYAQSKGLNWKIERVYTTEG